MSPSSSLVLFDTMEGLLQTDRFGQHRRGYQQIGSTNEVAKRWAQEGAPEGSLVLAEHQTAGRGRHGRCWTDQRGANLLFSLVLRPTTLPADQRGLITLAGGVAVAETVHEIVPSGSVSIKWPNDVRVNARKCCGMLLESAWNGEAPEYVVLGVGLNVNQETFPPELERRATSLRLESGRPLSRPPLLAALLHRLEVRYDALMKGGASAVRPLYEDYLAGLGETLTLRLTENGTHVQGVLDGVTQEGALRLRMDDGLRTFSAGDVTLSLPQ